MESSRITTYMARESKGGLTIISKGRMSTVTSLKGHSSMETVYMRAGLSRISSKAREF